MKFSVKDLPPAVDLETKPVLKQLAVSHRELALLNGRSATIPNESILIDTLSLQEARDSSAIENIITTHDELYKARLFGDLFTNAAAREVSRYADALKKGFERVRRQKIITNATILTVQQLLEGNKAGYREVPGTVLVNEQTGKTIYTPPQTKTEIETHMASLVAFINNDSLCDLDPLLKMALIHHQFETVHPFYDGNGRTGRILNILYLVQQGLLDLPVLYLSRYLIASKADYYRLLQSVRDTGEWEPWLLYLLKGVEQTARQTVVLIEGIRRLMQDYKQRMRNGLPKIYSQDLLNNLFRHPYTKIEFVIAELQVSRPTATAYLEALAGAGLLQKLRLGKSNYYMNNPLFALLREGAGTVQKTEPIVTQHGNGKAGKD